MEKQTYPALGMMLMAAAEAGVDVTRLRDSNPAHWMRRWVFETGG
jgi:hypothetical protein